MERRAYILIAEDDPASRHILTKLLTTQGYEVAHADNGAEALDKARQRPPDLLICDWMMPAMDGPTVVRELRTLPDMRALYIIMLTAKVEPQDTIDALDIGADDYIPKPFDPGILLARIRAGLRVAELEAELAARNERLEQTVRDLEKALAEVHTLRGLLPMCAWCRKVRNDNQYWLTLEEYVKQHAEVDFTHGICPECRQKLFSEGGEAT